MSLPAIVRIINLYEFADGSWDATMMTGDNKQARASNVDRDGVYEFINDQLYGNNDRRDMS